MFLMCNRVVPLLSTNSEGFEEDLRHWFLLKEENATVYERLPQQ